MLFRCELHALVCIRNLNLSFGISFARSQTYSKHVHMYMHMYIYTQALVVLTTSQTTREGWNWTNERTESTKAYWCMYMYRYLHWSLGKPVRARVKSLSRALLTNAPPRKRIGGRWIEYSYSVYETSELDALQHYTSKFDAMRVTCISLHKAWNMCTASNLLPYVHMYILLSDQGSIRDCMYICRNYLFVVHFRTLT